MAILTFNGDKIDLRELAQAREYRRLLAQSPILTVPHIYAIQYYLIEHDVLDGKAQLLTNYENQLATSARAHYILAEEDLGGILILGDLCIAEEIAIEERLQLNQRAGKIKEHPHKALHPYTAEFRRFQRNKALQEFLEMVRAPK